MSPPSSTISPGPIALRVADAALLVTALSELPDPRDLHAQRRKADSYRPPLPPRPADSSAGTDYVSAFGHNSLTVARLKVLRSACTNGRAATTVFEGSLEKLTSAAAELIDPLDISKYEWIAENRAAQYGTYWAQEDFAPNVEEFVARDLPGSTMADVFEFDRANSELEIPFLGQEFLEQNEGAPCSTQPEYTERMICFQQAADTGLDAPIAPTIGVAQSIDLVQRERYPGGASTRCAIARYPIITFNARYHQRLTVG